MIEPQLLIDAATEVLEKTADEVCGGAPDVQVERKVAQGTAAEVLVAEAVGAACSSSARAGTAASPSCCSAPSASSAPTTRRAPS
jgi:hypothetical protein